MLALCCYHAVACPSPPQYGRLPRPSPPPPKPRRMTPRSSTSIRICRRFPGRPQLPLCSWRGGGTTRPSAQVRRAGVGAGPLQEERRTRYSNEVQEHIPSARRPPSLRLEQPHVDYVKGEVTLNGGLAPPPDAPARPPSPRHTCQMTNSHPLLPAVSPPPGPAAP